MSTLTQAAPFKTPKTEYRTHYRFNECSQDFPYNGRMYVAIHIGCYATQLSWFNSMFDHLKKQIPFECTFGEPEVVILAGPCYKSMPSVQAQINFTIPDAEAVRLLTDAGFFAGLEQTLA